MRVNLSKINWIQLIMSYILRATILIALARAIWTQSWFIMFVSASIYLVTFLPAIVTRNIKVNLPVELEFAAVFFIYASLFLGEVHSYYTLFWWWDIFLHSFSSIVLGFIGFLVLFTLYTSNRMDASPFIIALFSFCFALAIGAVWEIFEFGVDQLLGFNMQKSGLVDTMWDLIVDAGGGLLTAIVGYFYVRGRPSFVIHHLLVRFAKRNPHLFRELPPRERK